MLQRFSLLTAAIGAPADIDRAREPSQGLGRLVRSLVGLNRAAVAEAFGDFLPAATATAAQIEFVNMIIEHLTDQGIIDPALLQEPVSKVAPASQLAWLCEHRSGAASVPVSTGAQENRVSRAERAFARLTARADFSNGLYEPPFKHIAPTGPDQVFDEQKITPLLARIEPLNQSAAA